MVERPGGKWELQQVKYAKHKVEGLDGGTDVWSEENPFGRQPLGLRIEALTSAGAYDAEGNITVIGFSGDDEFNAPASANGVTLSLETTTDDVKSGSVSGVLSAANTGA